MTNKKVSLKMNAYSQVQDKLEEGLRFAINRLEDITPFSLSDNERVAVIEPMLNELMLSLSEVVNWEKSG